MRLFKSFAVAAAFFAAAPASAQQVSVDPTFLSQSFGWSGNGSTTIIWRPMIIEGKLRSVVPTPAVVVGSILT